MTDGPVHAPAGPRKTALATPNALKARQFRRIAAELTDPRRRGGRRIPEITRTGSSTRASVIAARQTICATRIGGIQL